MPDHVLGPRWRFWRRRRDVLVVLTFLGFVDVILLRMSRKYFYCEALENSKDTTFQGSLLSWLTTDHGTSSNAFLYGYLLTVIPGGFLATKIGGQRLYGIRAVISVVVTIIIWASNTVNSQFILAIMFLEGLCRGLVDPSIICIWSQWFPLPERNRLIYFSMCGVPVGHIMAYVLVDAGRDCCKTELTGLVNIILFQILGTGWSLVWWLTVKDRPREDPNISPEELHHIEKFLTKDGTNGPNETTIFLKEVLASLPAWACVFASFAFSWNLASLLQQVDLPPFSSKLGIRGKEDAKKAILFTYTLVVLGMVIFGFSNDVMSRKHSFITNSRKVVICGSLMLSSATMLLCVFFVWGPLLLLCYSASLCFGFIGGAAVCVNLVDVASLQSSVLAGFGLVAGSLASIMVSKLTPYILQIEEKIPVMSTQNSVKFHTVPANESPVKPDSHLGPRWMFWRRRRDILTVLAFFGFINMSILRINLSIAILAMTSKYPVITNNGTTIYVQDFDFNPQTKGFILSAFFYGYMVTQIPGGWLATRMGGHKLYGAGIGVTALFTVLTPFIAQVHIYFLIVTRVIEGLCEGFTNSSIEYIWAQWVPPLERNRLMGFAFIGTPLGTVTAMSMSGIIATYLGWQAVFFITGSFALVWTLAWWIIVYDEPENDPRITLEELTHIRNCLGKRSNLKKRQEIVFPWCKMLTSLPIWAGVTVIFVMTWNYHTLGTQMPTFLSDVLGFDIKKAGLFSSMPYLVMAIYAPFACSAADWTLEKQLLSVTNTRKLFICFSLASIAAILLLLGHLRTTVGVISCLIVASCFDMTSMVSVFVNHLDLAPPYASLLTGLAHTMSSVSGVLATTLNGYVVRNKSSEEWTVLFSISGGICFFGAIFYGVFGSGELQTWALQGSEGQNGTLNCETLLHDVEILNPLGYAFSRRASELSFVERRRSRASEQSAEKVIPEEKNGERDRKI